MSKSKETNGNLPARAEIPGLPAEVAGLMGESKATGFEGIKPEDVAIPFLVILQSLSPQVKKGHASRVPDAEEGMLFNNVTQEVYKEGIQVVPCAFQKAYVEWVTRENGGGFVASHQDEKLLATCKRDEKNNDILPNGNQLATTAYHFVLIVKPDGSWERAVIGMSRTQLKKSRRWISQMMAIQMKDGKGKLFRPPMYSHKYRLTAVLEQKDDYSWYNYQIEGAEPIQDPDLFREAMRFNADVVGGLAKVGAPPVDGVEVTPAPEGM